MTALPFGEQLELASQLLSEYSAIGLWSKSDDCSDDRQRRRCLREVDWAISDALRAPSEVSAVQPDVQAEVDALGGELRSLVATFEPLPDLVTDTMGENPALDVTILESQETLSRLLDRMNLLLKNS